MKKSLIFLLSILLTLTLAGCTGSVSESAQSNEIPAADGSPQGQTDAVNPQSQNVSNSYMPGPTAMVQNFNVLNQYPELPTGCEVTSLTMVLNYNNVPADKCDIADNYLEKGEVGTVDFRVEFVGDPRDEDSYGCYAPVLTNAANNYLTANGYNLKATDISGTSFDGLLPYIDKGIPVIIWGTQECQPGQYTTTWNIDGEDITWYYPEHCMVLLGYSDYQVWVADPMYGEVRDFDRVIFQTRYEELFQQAIVIQ